MKSYKTIDVDIEKHVATCTLSNPPEQLMNSVMVGDLLSLATEMEKDDDVRVVILTGGVTGIFITHYDVKELEAISKMMKGATPKKPAADKPQTEKKRRPLHPTNLAYNKFENMSKPVIAAINGVAMGGGCELTLACDLRYMADVGMIGLPESTVGILPGAGGTQRLPRLIGASKALEMMLLGRVLTPTQAEDIGLVHKVVAADKLLDHCKGVARILASRPPLTMTNIKKCVNEGMETSLLEGLHLEQNYFNELMNSTEALELMSSFNKKGGALKSGG